MSDNGTSISMTEVKSKMDLILTTLNSIKEESIQKVYTTEELCEYLHIGKPVIRKYINNGEISYSKIGRTFLFTQSDVDQLLENNKVKYVV